MSIESLPDELLDRIAKLTVSAQRADDDHMHDGKLPPLLGAQSARCINYGVSDFSMTSQRMRRICTPTLFSEIVVAGRSGLSVLLQTLPGRLWIAKHIW
jgi:hypothetical protein